MSFSIISTDRFKREIKRLSKKYHSLKGEYEELISVLETNPETGTYLGSGCFKIRLAIAGKRVGKSGGAGVITYYYKMNNCLYLLTIYDKSEKENFAPNELKKIIKDVHAQLKQS